MWPTVEGTLLATGASRAIRAKIAVENTGSADIPLRVVLLTVSAYGTAEVDENGHPVWRDVARAHAFRDDEGEPDHLDIESQETITDDVVIPIPASVSGTSIVAYRITCHVYERRNEGGGICWTTKAVVPALPTGATALTTALPEGAAAERDPEPDQPIGVGDSEPVGTRDDVPGESGQAARKSSVTFNIESQEASRITTAGRDVSIPTGAAPSAQQRPADEDEIKAAERRSWRPWKRRGD